MLLYGIIILLHYHFLFLRTAIFMGLLCKSFYSLLRYLITKQNKTKQMKGQTGSVTSGSQGHEGRELEITDGEIFLMTWRKADQIGQTQTKKIVRIDK